MNSVLIIERDPSTLSTLTNLLESLDIRFDIMRSWNPGQFIADYLDYRVVLVSVEVPNLNIEELTMFLQRLNRDSEEESVLMLMSRSQNPKLLKEYQQVDHAAVLQKPIECGSLFRALTNFSNLDFGQPLSNGRQTVLKQHQGFLRDYGKWFLALEQVATIQ